MRRKSDSYFNESTILEQHLLDFIIIHFLIPIVSSRVQFAKSQWLRMGQLSDQTFLQLVGAHAPQGSFSTSQPEAVKPKPNQITP